MKTKKLLKKTFKEIHGQQPLRTFTVSEVKQIVYPLITKIRDLEGI